ncbi:hypothetical protein GH714_040443 [Hevea brasiliensis]|uniref:Uncharacterized protein n=1 Tax=Hevea brasiliensis TaxID=3981 RepID=A0A6A6L7R7_HEVBR|nr:hypothetical protein GH714_040443 [Hevea brasiliensis]
MDKSESSHIIGEGENGDEFYEKIEAPKFVDLTAPDPTAPAMIATGSACESVVTKSMKKKWTLKQSTKILFFGSWLQEVPMYVFEKHCIERIQGEFTKLFSDYNSGVSSLIAVAEHIPTPFLCSSTQLKCPRTVPAKPSRSRVSRIALISSISKRIVDPKVKVKPLCKQSATPNAKTKQSSSIAKALTTPRTKKQLANPDAFRSVKNPKITSIAVPKNRVVAKTLIFIHLRSR